MELNLNSYVRVNLTPTGVEAVMRHAAAEASRELAAARTLSRPVILGMVEDAVRPFAVDEYSRELRVRVVDFVKIFGGENWRGLCMFDGDEIIMEGDHQG